MANGPGDGAQTIEMKKFIEMAVKNFGLPQFQRPPTWNWEHQRDLLQSIYLKVPIGSVMIWEYNRDITPDLEYRRLDQINQNKQDITHLILDGQQRMRFLTLLWLSTRDKTYCNQLRKNSGHIYFYPEGDPASRNEIVHFRIEKERS